MDKLQALDADAVLPNLQTVRGRNQQAFMMGGVSLDNIGIALRRLHLLPRSLNSRPLALDFLGRGFRPLSGLYCLLTINKSIVASRCGHD